MAMHDALNRRQTDTRAFEGLLRVKPLEDAEQLVRIFHVEADAIVSNEQHYLMVFVFHASDLDLCLGTCARELWGFGDEVNQNEPQHGTISIPFGQRIELPNDFALVRILADLS